MCSIGSPGRTKFPVAVTVGSKLGGRFWGIEELRKTMGRRVYCQLGGIFGDEPSWVSWNGWLLWGLEVV